MILGLSVAVLSVLLGTAFGLVRGSKPMARSLRTFAVVSAVCLVLGRIVPDALAHGGLVVLVVLGGAFFLPGVLERLSQRALRGKKGDGTNGAHGESRWVLEASYAGLLIHQVGDGIGIGTYATGAHAGHTHWEVHLAIAAHTVPITAVMAAALAVKLGRVATWFRAILLAAASVAGVLVVDTLLAVWMAPSEPWILAIVGGLLLHVVAHGHAEDQDLPSAHHHGEAEQRCEPSARGMSVPEALGALLGVSLLFLGGSHEHGVGARDPAAQVLAALLSLTREASPALLVGIVLGAALQLWGSAIPIRWLRGGGAISQSLRGALVGLPIPICSCGVLPVVASLRRRGATAAVVASFLIAAPELGIETFALTVRFFGWRFAVFRLAAALLVAIVTALVLAAAVGSRSAGSTADAAAARADQSAVILGAGRSMSERFWRQCDDLLAHVGPWLLLGLLVAAYATVAVGAPGTGPVTTGSLAGDLSITTFMAIPSYVCASSATPLAAVLVAGGFHPGAALLGLLLGPATNVATFGFLIRSYGWRATLLSTAALVATGWALAIGMNGVLGAPPPLTVASAHAHEGAWLGHAAIAILLLATLVSMMRRGLGQWFGALSPVGFDTKHGHGAHDHSGHGHGAHDHVSRA